jgi:PAS domain S-box-containing protein
MKSSSKSRIKGADELDKSIKKQKAQLTKLKNELAQTTERLVLSENRFNALMANSLDAMALFDKDFNILYRSPTAYKISGWTEEDLSKSPPIMNVHADDVSALREKLQESLLHADKSIEVSFRSRHKLGHYIWVEGTFKNMLETSGVRAIVLSIRDITSRKSAEQHAAISKANLDTIFENMSEGVVIMNPEGIIQVFNRNAVRFAFLGTGKTLTAGENIQDYIDEPRQDFFAKIKSIVLSGKNFEYDREIKENEKKYWINVAINAILEEHQLRGICMVTRDITSRKEAELEIAESEERFRTLIERISDGFVSFDNDLHYTYANKKAGEITHHDPKSLIGRYVWDVFPEAVGSSTYETFTRAMSDQVYLCNTDYFEPLDLWQENHLYPSENGLSVFIRDISERKKAERKLIESEKRFRAIIENNADAIVLTDANLKVSYQSPAVERITGISLEHRIANPGIQYSHPDDRALIAAAVKESIHNPGKAIPFQSRFLHLNGGSIWIEGFMTNLLDDPHVKSIVFNYRDVSERKAVEEQILKLNDELEAKVTQRTIQLEALNKELESFTYSVSHDLRAPLRIIDGFSHILLEDYVNVLDESGKKNLHVIVNNAKRMGLLIDDLLNFSKVGKAELRMGDVNMNLLVSDVLEELKMSGVTIPEGLTVENLDMARGDAPLLKQVWINLISNAIKYSGKKNNPSIQIGVHKRENKTVYFVKDNGAGFDMKYVDKLFGVFQRLHKIEDFAGTGVGLALVQRIIARHGGSVWAEAKVNEGATFYFTLEGQA